MIFSSLCQNNITILLKHMNRFFFYCAFPLACFPIFIYHSSLSVNLYHHMPYSLVCVSVALSTSVSLFLSVPLCLPLPLFLLSSLSLSFCLPSLKLSSPESLSHLSIFFVSLLFHLCDSLFSVLPLSLPPFLSQSVNVIQ